ncbi:MAG: preprotein translocase subunit SecG [Deltaproteobacteria bacterium]|nr:preprotein translocase subunit SecG [Deltaproteobacteria bacterium]
MLVTFITVVHVLVCIFLILVILLQAGKDAGMGAAFGGGGSGTVFGGRGAGSFLGKVTAICATIFFVTSLSLSFAASYRPSVAGLIKPATEQPAKPAEAPAAAPAPAADPNASAPAQPAAPAEGAAPAQPAPAAPEAPAPAK